MFRNFPLAAPPLAAVSLAAVQAEPGTNLNWVSLGNDDAYFRQSGEPMKVTIVAAPNIGESPFQWLECVSKHSKYENGDLVKWYAIGAAHYQYHAGQEVYIFLYRHQDEQFSASVVHLAGPPLSEDSSPPTTTTTR